MKKLLLTLVACVTALAANAWTVYFTNPAGWTNVSVYTFNSETLGTWPGQAMTKNNSTGLWEYTSGTGSPKNIIFNNNNNGEQTDNLDFQQGAIYTFVGPMPSELYMIGKVGSIDWNPTEGVKMTSEGNGVFTLEGININGGFAFASKLGSNGSDWNTLNQNRYGPQKIKNDQNQDVDAPAVIGNNSINSGGDLSWSFSTPGTYDVKVDLMTSVLTISVPVTPPTYPDELYLIGNMGSSNWDVPGKAFENEGEGQFKLEGIKLGQSKTVNGYFALTTVNSSDWNEINGNRYGPTTNTTISLKNNEAEVDFVRNNNGQISWNIEPGVYTLIVSFDGNLNLLTIKKTGEFDEPEPETPEDLYLLANMNTANWVLPGTKFNSDGNGIFTLTDITLLGANGPANLALTTSDSEDWGTVNANRYGPTTNTTLSLDSNNTAKDTFIRSTNSTISWEIEAGIYDITVNFDDYTITLEKTGDVPVTEAPTLYILGNNINGSEDWDKGSEMTYKDNGVYTWIGDILGSGFKIRGDSWSSGYNYGIASDVDNHIILGENVTVVNHEGSTDVEFTNLTWIQNPTVTFDKNNMTVKVTGVKPLFLRGSEIVGGNPWKEEQTGAWDINSSYLFEQSVVDGNIVYTLNVASISSTCEFKIGTEDWDPAYSSNAVDATKLEITQEDDYVLLTNMQSEDYNLKLAYPILNATFTLTLHANEDPIDEFSGPYTVNANLVISGTKDGGSDWVLTPGNDKTMQDGSVEGNTITLTTITNGALVYVYPPQGAVNVYFKLGNGAQSEKRRLTAADLTGFTQAAKYPGDDNAYMLPLPVGSGDATLYYEKEGGELSDPVTYTYTVSPGVPTGVDGIGADEEDAVYYNLQGVKVDNPEKGIFVKVVNGTASKVVL